MTEMLPDSTVPTREQILIALLSRRRYFTEITTRFRKPDQLWPATKSGQRLMYATAANVVLLILTVTLALLFGGGDKFTDRPAYQILTLVLLTCSFLISAFEAVRVFQDMRERSLMAFIALAVSWFLFWPILVWLLGVLSSITES